MIKFENTEVMGWEAAIRGMRNPHNSWDKSDSDFCSKSPDSEMCEVCEIPDDTEDFYCIGLNDLALMKNLAEAGTDHRKFMRMIIVTVDITAPLYWWKEFDTYKVGTVANSCSTMHKIHEKPFTVNDFSIDTLMTGNLINSDGNISAPKLKAHYKHMMNILASLNNLRDLYIKTADKTYWKCMIEILPSSYNQKRTVMLNYEVLRNISDSRRNHKLDEWSVGFMEWIDSLPYATSLLKGDE